MKSNDFYSKFNEKIKDLNLEQIKDIMNNIIRKIPESKYNEVLDMFEGTSTVDINKIESTIKEYTEKFELIDEFELYFHATGYEDYDEYYSSWDRERVYEYTDDEDVGDIIDDAFDYAVELTNKKQYKYAKEIFDLILSTNYQVLDDDGGDVLEISLKELKENGLININILKMKTFTIYL